LQDRQSETRDTKPIRLPKYRSLPRPAAQFNWFLSETKGREYRFKRWVAFQKETLTLPIAWTGPNIVAEKQQQNATCVLICKLFCRVLLL
jgi:hypothetical protein